jgi:hypothetical protein
MNIGGALKALPILIFAFALNVSAGSDIHGFRYQSCKSDHTVCIRISSDFAEGSQFKSIFYIKKLDLDFVDFKSQKIIESLSGSGFIDFSNNQVILKKVADDQSITETIVNMDSLQKDVVVTK